ncbi:MAG: hypothetical protein PHF20_06245 [Halothiobacillaceae bacterium]|nr:hypothetical protein [Halothiobacillaceae bacterium]
MSAEHKEREPAADTDASAEAENQLKQQREVLRKWIAKDKEDDGKVDIEVIGRMAVPLARQFVREHPYASLAGAALAGAWLVHIKPWRALGGLLEQQALGLTLSSGVQLLEGLTAAARSRQTPKRKP